MIKLAPLSVGISSVKATNTFWVLSLTPVVDFFHNTPWCW